jgi:hypothetical protein
VLDRREPPVKLVGGERDATLHDPAPGIEEVTVEPERNRGASDAAGHGGIMRKTKPAW